MLLTSLDDDGAELTQFDNSDKSSLKNALFALAEMIEKWDVNEGKGGEMRLNDGEMKALRLLLVNLQEIEEFYNCIGGIIGFVFFVICSEIV